MGRDYAPGNDQQYDAWLANFVTVLGINMSMVGLVAADMEPITSAQEDFAVKYPAFVQARQAAKSATSAKVTSRTESEAILRPLVRRIQNHPGMTDQLRSMLGLTPQYVAASSVPVSELMPILVLESAPGQVTVHWGPNPGNEHLNGKPSGVKGANIYRRKTGDTTYQLVGYATSSPFIDSITGPASDYTYVARYRGTKQTDLSKESEANTIAARGELAKAA